MLGYTPVTISKLIRRPSTVSSFHAGSSVEKIAGFNVFSLNDVINWSRSQSHPLPPNQLDRIWFEQGKYKSGLRTYYPRYVKWEKTEYLNKSDYIRTLQAHTVPETYLRLLALAPAAGFNLSSVVRSVLPKWITQNKTVTPQQGFDNQKYWPMPIAPQGSLPIPYKTTSYTDESFWKRPKDNMGFGPWFFDTVLNPQTVLTDRIMYSGLVNNFADVVASELLNKTDEMLRKTSYRDLPSVLLALNDYINKIPNRYLSFVDTVEEVWIDNIKGSRKIPLSIPDSADTGPIITYNDSQYTCKNALRKMIEDASVVYLWNLEKLVARYNMLKNDNVVLATSVDPNADPFLVISYEESIKLGKAVYQDVARNVTIPVPAQASVTPENYNVPNIPNVQAIIDIPDSLKSLMWQYETPEGFAFSDFDRGQAGKSSFIPWVIGGLAVGATALGLFS